MASESESPGQTELIFKMIPEIISNPILAIAMTPFEATNRIQW
jgi:hypothetical protein